MMRTKLLKNSNFYQSFGSLLRMAPDDQHSHTKYLKNKKLLI
jgi:hypothetical protein